MFPKKETGGDWKSLGDYGPLRVPMIYLSGPMTGSRVLENVALAIVTARELLRRGYIPVVPHLGWYLDQAEIRDYDWWLEADLRLLSYCQACLMIGDWEKSQGAKVEHDYCYRENIPVFYDIECLPHLGR